MQTGADGQVNDDGIITAENLIIKAGGTVDRGMIIYAELESKQADPEVLDAIQYLLEEWDYAIEPRKASEGTNEGIRNDGATSVSGAAETDSGRTDEAGADPSSSQASTLEGEASSPPPWTGRLPNAAVRKQLGLRRRISAEDPKITREQFMLGLTIGGAILSTNPPFCINDVSDGVERALEDITPDYVNNVAKVIAEHIGYSRMMVEDLQQVLDATLVTIADHHAKQEARLKERRERTEKYLRESVRRAEGGIKE